MEVAGLVLGAIPVAIQGFQTYRTILSSMKNTKRDLKAMIRVLNTELLILQNTCEILLRGIASDSEIEGMIDNPYGDAWNKYNDEVRLRLWRSGPSFQDQVEDMMNATVELKEKLAIDDQGKVSYSTNPQQEKVLAGSLGAAWRMSEAEAIEYFQTRLTDRASILTELKLKTSFTLRKDEYDHILTRLQKGNAVLSALATQNSDLESTRRSRSHAKAARLIRRLSEAIFSALLEALTCRCIGSHNIGLIIAPRKPVLLPGDEEEDAAKALSFDVVLGTNQGDSQKWNRMRVKLAEKQFDPLPTSATSGPPKKRLRWASSILTWSEKVNLTSSSKTSPSVPSEVYDLNTGLRRPPITNLCQSLQKGKGLSSDCYGFICGRSREFGIYHQDCPSDSHDALTLRDMLKSRTESIANFGYPERLRLALTLSFGVLHLYSTPWLSKVVTLDDIVFLHGGSTDTSYLDRPFLAKQVPEASRQTQDAAPLSTSSSHEVSQQRKVPNNTHRPIDSTLLAFGLLLIQIIVGDYSEQLRVEDGMTMDRMLEKQTIAFAMAGVVLEKGGMNYASAVQWCLENFLSVANLENEELAGQFYDRVIFKLETDMKFQGPAVSI